MSTLIWSSIFLGCHLGEPGESSVERHAVHGRQLRVLHQDDDSSTLFSWLQIALISPWLSCWWVDCALLIGLCWAWNLRELTVQFTHVEIQLFCKKGCQSRRGLLASIIKQCQKFGRPRSDCYHSETGDVLSRRRNRLETVAAWTGRRKGLG